MRCVCILLNGLPHSVRARRAPLGDQQAGTAARTHCQRHAGCAELCRASIWDRRQREAIRVRCALLPSTTHFAQSRLSRAVREAVFCAWHRSVVMQPFLQNPGERPDNVLPTTFSIASVLVLPALQ